MKRTEKRMWLVVVRTNLDELPAGLYCNRRSALARAKSITQKQINDLARLMRVDNAGFVCCALIEFKGTKAVNMEIVRDLDDDATDSMP